ncbi:uncharacterized protein LOC113560234 [Rhopalosiphum maidis]|uniref:uncharacterized protein LOC113560234 n=1 Tax=Rhopalosiphum maidis TaxID=43146 RepID=UPI000EFF49F3|nr:uncharacterized protein LOC113560234 [Rhopalosiphum maidis]XP_026821798.1 uncharacterized protein LOC113560234 [Rhopalosiphum maidis]
MDTNPNSDTYLKNTRELDNLSTEFGKLSLAEAQQSINQLLDNIKMKSSDEIKLPTPRSSILRPMLKVYFAEKFENFHYIDKHLYYLNRNIYQSFLKHRVKVSPKTTNGLVIHLVAFQTFVNDHGKFLVGCKQWSTVVDYIFMAWKHVDNMPIDTSIMHVRARRDCFCLLLRYCIIALIKLKNTFSKEKKEHCLKYLKLLCDTSEDEIVKNIQEMFFKYIYSIDFLE